MDVYKGCLSAKCGVVPRATLKLKCQKQRISLAGRRCHRSQLTVLSKLTRNESTNGKHQNCVVVKYASMKISNIIFKLSPAVSTPKTPIIAKVVEDKLKRIGNGVLGFAAATTLWLGSPLLPLQSASADPLTFPVAEKPELFSAQKTLVEAWSILTETYVDPTFNHLDWQRELSSKLNSIATAPSKDAAAEQIATMVSKLGDPFTRWVSPKDYEDFRVSSDGELKGGVGLLIAQDPASGRLLVLAPIQGSPADRAGIKPGDEVLKVNGRHGWRNSSCCASWRARKFCNGRSRTKKGRKIFFRFFPISHSYFLFSYPCQHLFWNYGSYSRCPWPSPCC